MEKIKEIKEVKEEEEVKEEKQGEEEGELVTKKKKKKPFQRNRSSSEIITTPTMIKRVSSKDAFSRDFEFFEHKKWKKMKEEEMESFINERRNRSKSFYFSPKKNLYPQRRRRRNLSFFKKNPKKTSIETSPQNKDYSGMWDLHFFIYTKNIDEVKKQIKEGRDLNLFNIDQNTPLHCAVISKNIEMVKLLLDQQDVNPNMFNRMKQTPLLIALKYKMLDVLEVLLINKNVKKNRKDKNGILLINKYQSKETDQVFNKIIEKEKLFLQAIKEENIEKMKDLCNQIDINCQLVVFKENINENPLDIAIKIQNKSTLEFLVENGVEIRKQTLVDTTIKSLKFLKRKYRENKRRELILNLIREEKCFYDSLNVMHEILIKPSMLVFIKIKKSLKNKVLEKTIEKFYENFYIIKLTHFGFFFRLVGIDFKDEFKMLEIISNYPLKYYLDYISSNVKFEHLVKSEKKLKEILKCCLRQEKVIPYPKFRSSFVLFSQIKIRIAKYRMFLERMIKFSNEIEDSVYKILEETSQKISKNFKKMGETIEYYKSRTEIEKISKSFQDKWNINFLHENLNRKYIWSQDKIAYYNVLEKKNRLCKIFFFSDSIWIEDSKNLKFHFLFDRKTIIIINSSDFRIIIEKNKVKLLNCIFICENTSHLYSELKKNILKSQFADYYFSKLLIINHLNESDEIKSFFLFDSTDPLQVKEQQIETHTRKLETLEKEKESVVDEIYKAEREVEDFESKKNENSENMNQIQELIRENYSRISEDQILVNQFLKIQDELFKLKKDDESLKELTKKSDDENNL